MDSQYLRGTTTKALHVKKLDLGLQGYIDANMAGDIDCENSTTEYVFVLGGTTVIWVSTLQKIVALSITEANYVAVKEANKELIWLQSILKELD